MVAIVELLGWTGWEALPEPILDSHHSSVLVRSNRRQDLLLLEAVEWDILVLHQVLQSMLDRKLEIEGQKNFCVDH